MNLRYTTEYYPNLDELTQQQLDDARVFVVQKLREKFVDVDLSPGTVTGDQVVAPLSEFIAAADVAFSRFMSDLDMGNVAENVIYSCPFVEGFLGNFSVYDDSNLQSIGVVRLTFSADQAVTLTRNLAFRFGTDDEYRVRFSSEHGEYFEILPTSSPPTTADDTLVLVQTSNTTWAVDVPVFGAMTDEVAAGSVGTINKLLPNLNGVAAVVDFIRGATPTSLPALARKARKTFHSMSATSRHGIRSTVYHHWPETVMVSPIIPNDLEMLRGAPGTAMALPDIAVDVYYRSSRDIYPQTQLVKLRYTSTATHNGVSNSKRFRGKLPFLHSPSKIISIKPVGLSVDAIVSATVYSRATTSDIPYGLHHGTRFEEFYIDINPVISEGDSMPIIPRFAEYDGAIIDGHYAMFEIQYEADPLLKAVAAHLESPDQTAAGVSTVVHAGPLVDIDAMTIYYYRRPGVKMLLNPAVDKIVDYAKNAGYPEVFTPTAIHDIMKIAGASMVSSIDVSGQIRSTPADRWLPYNAGFSLPGSLDEDWFAGSYAPNPQEVASVADMSPNLITTVVDANAGGSNPQSLITVMTKRTVRYRIESAGINFVELA